MIDLLVNVPERQALIDLGFSLGILRNNNEHVPPLANGVNIHEIGVHSYRTGGTDEEPVLETAPGWWVMLRADDDYPVPPEILPFVIERDPENPAVPNRMWA